ncbi:MAG: hypothetical protein DSM107014_09465 [Gomphosphaeria aponina SAG 52.96 = DSM 107014]|uniref:Uncharacterized protein n=1 Tax=Gomphosphaeria aponina SAG 52.96 = DSM 107014 TaxID=1521640 RepID=A0A941GTU3_9CHRO|nr:hypothetical protein [Gomphosphaeria aponina SAG 52.96 = DSM 107014]
MKIKKSSETTREKVVEKQINHQEVRKAKEELDLIMEKVLEQTGLTEEEYIKTFINARKVN